MRIRRRCLVLSALKIGRRGTDLTFLRPFLTCRYIHLNETLVAPIWDSSQNVTSRDTWVPPGEWQDVWTGDTVTGPKTVTSTLPYEQQPMWHRKGGFLITTSNPGSSVDTQDWSELTVEAFPSSTTEATTVHPLHARGSMAKTELRMQSSGESGVRQLRHHFWTISRALVSSTASTAHAPCATL